MGELCNILKKRFSLENDKAYGDDGTYSEDDSMLDRLSSRDGISGQNNYTVQDTRLVIGIGALFRSLRNRCKL